MFKCNSNKRFQEDVIGEPTHGGTHLDSPIHFYKGGKSISEIPLERMLGVPIALVDVEAKAALNSSYSFPSKTSETGNTSTDSCQAAVSLSSSLDGPRQDN
ncbi:unnamed protein product [Ixodes hexagonus]